MALALTVALVATGVAVLDFDERLSAVSLFLVFIGTLIGATPLAIAIHEFGHAAAGMLVGERVYRIRIGVGVTLKEFYIGETQVLIGRELNSGIVYSGPSVRPGRWRTAISLLGGAAANLGAAAAIIALLALASAGLAGGAPPLVSVLACAIALGNVMAGLGALVPGQNRIEGASLPSDGRKLLRLWRAPAPSVRDRADPNPFWGHRLLRDQRWAEAKALFEAVLARDPQQFGFLGVLVAIIARTDGPEAALDDYLDRVETLPPPDATSAATAHTWASIAWQAVLTGDPTRLSLAETLSERAFLADPTDPWVRASRGATLAAAGDVEGLTLLTAALRDLESREGQAEFCRFLADEAARRGDGGTAETYAALQRHLLARR
jgi:hypothetical protein